MAIFNENDLMRLHILIIIALASSLLISRGLSYTQNRTKYVIQVRSDGSSTWFIKQTGTDIQASLTTLIEFRDKAVSLVASAMNETQREMTADNDSMSISSTVSGSYITVEYRFRWQNFSKIENPRIVIGDVFRVKDFFSQLYGEGEVQMTYPPEYVVESVLPPPSEQNDTLQAIVWPGTEDIENAGSTIILIEKDAASELIGNFWKNAILVTSLLALVTGSSIGFYAFKRYRKKQNTKIGKRNVTGVPGMESDEEKILRLLISSNGSLYQSVIVEQCKFSKAKTSQLLATLESKKVVVRHKKGRDKIVTLIEKKEK